MQPYDERAAQVAIDSQPSGYLFKIQGETMRKISISLPAELRHSEISLRKLNR
jgi:hypothetical protein